MYELLLEKHLENRDHDLFEGEKAQEIFDTISALIKDYISESEMHLEPLSVYDFMHYNYDCLINSYIKTNFEVDMEIIDSINRYIFDLYWDVFYY